MWTEIWEEFQRVKKSWSSVFNFSLFYAMNETLVTLVMVKLI